MEIRCGKLVASLEDYRSLLDHVDTTDLLSAAGNLRQGHDSNSDAAKELTSTSTIEIFEANLDKLPGSGATFLMLTSLRNLHEPSRMPSEYDPFQAIRSEFSALHVLRCQTAYVDMTAGLTRERNCFTSQSLDTAELMVHGTLHYLMGVFRLKRIPWYKKYNLKVSRHCKLVAAASSPSLSPSLSLSPSCRPAAVPSPRRPSPPAHAAHLSPHLPP
ncbi:MAG: hypothetical protein OTI36_20790 [Beijerinckiaceae bacterium]|nr:hypothetical protein [Beijerinckiaceae bacterium]